MRCLVIYPARTTDLPRLYPFSLSIAPFIPYWAETPLVCCIYHKPRQFDESSSDESSDSGSDSGADSDDGRARRRRCDHNHDPDHNHDHNHGGPDGAVHDPQSNGGVVHELEDSDGEANAYERAPRRKPKKGQGAGADGA